MPGHGTAGCGGSAASVANWRRPSATATQLNAAASSAKADVTPDGEFKPQMFGFDKYPKGVPVSTHVLK